MTLKEHLEQHSPDVPFVVLNYDLHEMSIVALEAEDRCEEPYEGKHDVIAVLKVNP